MTGVQENPLVAQLASPAKASEASQHTKPVHTIILDASPLLLSSPSISTLLGQSHAIITTPAVIAEIKDPSARSRIESLYLPFITIRSPKAESLGFIRDFARKTGDLAVLSNTDIEILALAYDLECERNGGDWRLRKVPGQKKLNGRPPAREQRSPDGAPNNVAAKETHESSSEEVSQGLNDLELDGRMPAVNTSPDFENPIQEIHTAKLTQSEEQPDYEAITSSDSDSEGWITPSNIKKHQAEHDTASTSSKTEAKVMQAATITGDFAMQNVLLQMNLNLLSPATCKRITNVKQTILRCHGCFATTKDMTKQFCPRCGKPTLTRVTCTTNDAGEVKLHLKAKMQWNNRGNVFSVPKPASGTSNQKWQGPKHGGGGQGGWGNELILAEDQKEYIRAMTSEKRGKDKDLMDEDYLPNILTGDRNRNVGRAKVGAGRNVNSRRR